MRKFLIVCALALIFVGGCTNPFTDPLIPNQTALTQKPAVSAATESAEFFNKNVKEYQKDTKALKEWAAENLRAWKELKRVYDFKSEKK